MSDGLLNIEQAAEYLGIAKKTLYGYTAARTVPFTRVGKKSIRFSQEHLDAIVAAGQHSVIATPTRLQLVAGRPARRTHPPAGPSTPPPPSGPKTDSERVA